VQVLRLGQPVHALRRAGDRPALSATLDAAATRIVDLLVASVALVLLAPLMLLAALLIHLDGEGPVLFVQKRVGRDGRHFRMWKFRTMRPSNDERVHQELARAWFQGSDAVRGYRKSGDDRVTRVGRILRGTNFDELPQLVNVIRGDMSLVGPRPAIPYELEHYQESYYDRLKVKPGITGPWQVSGRDRRTAPEMMALDLAYVATRSVWADLKILARTVPVLLADLAAVAL
jgi:lipopolysaccharide/colanic/teichoic acid biosynthesis glycosyltransferase